MLKLAVVLGAPVAMLATVASLVALVVAAGLLIFPHTLHWGLPTMRTWHAAVLPQGALRLLGPTGGYLMAYPIAAFVAGYLAERGFDKRYWTSFVALAAGLAIVFAFGVTWLATFVAPATGFSGAIAAGFTPFIVADLAKLALAAGILPSFWRFTGK